MNIGCGMVRIAHDRKPNRSTETIASSCSSSVEEANSVINKKQRPFCFKREYSIRRFTLFTLLYLVTGICLTAIAFQYPNMTQNSKISLSVAAGVLYLCAVCTTFPSWHQLAQQSQAGLRSKPAWHRNFITLAKPIGTIIVPWLIIGWVLVLSISDVVNRNWEIEALASAALRLPLVFLSVENILVRNQVHQ